MNRLLRSVVPTLGAIVLLVAIAVPAVSTAWRPLGALVNGVAPLLAQAPEPQPQPQPQTQPAPAPATAPAARPAAPTLPALPERPALPTAPQPPQAGAPDQGAPETDAAPEPDDDVRFERRRRDRRQGTVRFGQDYTLAAGETANEAVVIGGNATIDGHVEGDLVVVGGTATLSSTAVVDGDFVVVGGVATVAEGAVVSGDAVVVGGGLNAPPSFRPGGEQVIVGIGDVGAHLGGVVQWATRGPLIGRLFVPDLPWNWVVALVTFLLYLLIATVFDRPVQRCVRTLDAKPVTAFLVGLLVILLTGPAIGLLFVSVVGILLVPFVLVAVIVAALVGRVTVAEWLGLRILRPESMESRLTPVLALAIGFVLFCLAYMVPVIGLLMWMTAGLLGLGAVTLTAVEAYRDENPRPLPHAPAPIPPIPTAPATAYPTESAGSAMAAETGGPTAGFQAAAYAASGFVPGAQADPGAAWPGSPGGTPPAPGIPPTVPGFATPPRAAGYDMATLPRAAFAERTAAFVLDAVLVFLLFSAFPGRQPGPVLFATFLAYRIAAWTWKSATLGAVICQLRVTRADGQRLSFADALVRGLSSIFSIVVLGLGCFWVLRDEERQAWHDRVAGTYVVKVPRNFPL